MASAAAVQRLTLPQLAAEWCIFWYFDMLSRDNDNKTNIDALSERQIFRF